jgi:HK97 gp10 family phage protein
MGKDDFKIEGIVELERMMKRLGKVPQTVVTKAARAGANIAYKAARANAPVDRGDLKGGIKLKPERRTVLGKKVYDVIMDPEKNDLFVKYTKDGIRYYYPASQEYGYRTVNGRYIPGFRYLRHSLTNNIRAIEAKVIEVAGKEVDKAMKAK